MLYDFLLLLPSAICLIWFLAFLLEPDKKPWSKAMLYLTITASVSFFCDAGFIGNEQNRSAIVVYDVLSSFATTSTPILFLIYIVHLKGCTKFHTKYLLLFIPPVALASVLLTNYVTMGIDVATQYMTAKEACNGLPAGFDERIFKLSYITGVGIYYPFMFCEIILLTAHIIRSMIKTNFSFRDFIQKIRNGIIVVGDFICIMTILLFVTISVRLVLLRILDIDSHLLNCTLFALHAIFIYYICYGSVFTEWTTISVKEFAYPYRQTYSSDSERQKKQARESSAAGTVSRTHNKYYPDFERLMLQEKRYLDPNLTIDTIAQEMHSNRTYVSKIVNSAFNMSFRDYIGLQRIEHAKRLMTETPEAMIEDIALNSGFLSASQFNRKFKESEGLSPRQWQANNNLHPEQTQAETEN